MGTVCAPSPLMLETKRGGGGMSRPRRYHAGPDAEGSPGGPA